PEVKIAGTGTYDLQNSGQLVIEDSSFPVACDGLSPSVAYFDGDAAPFPWMIRTFQPGDRIVPLGMSGRKKVKDIFIDEKIPLRSRGRLPLLFSRERLIWVCCLKASAETRVTDGTGRVLRAELLDFIP
ncbi:MAG: tRNA(Ile)-lysidine synthetase, partial [Deltaproteobacteria bacterium]